MELRNLLADVLPEPFLGLANCSAGVSTFHLVSKFDGYYDGIYKIEIQDLAKKCASVLTLLTVLTNLYNQDIYVSNNRDDENKKIITWKKQVQLKLSSILTNFPETINFPVHLHNIPKPRTRSITLLQQV